MRSYEDISKRIMERGDKLIESRRVRAAKIRHTSYAVSGMCAAAIAGIGVWRLASDVKKPDGGFSGSVIVSETETHSEAVTTASKPANAVKTTSEKTTAVKTTAVTTDKKTTETASAKAVSTEAASTAAPVRTTAVTAENRPASRTTTAEAVVSPTTAVTTTAINEIGEVITPATTKAPTGEEIAVRTTTVSVEEGVVTTKPDSAVTTLPNGLSGGGNGNLNGGTQTAPVTTATSVTTTTSIQDAFRTYPAYITLKGVRYDKEGVISAEQVGSRISRVDVNIQYLRKNITAVMSAYVITGTDEEEAVAVRLKDTDEYYIFRNASYKKED